MRSPCMPFITTSAESIKPSALLLLWKLGLQITFGALRKSSGCCPSRYSGRVDLTRKLHKLENLNLISDCNQGHHENSAFGVFTVHVNSVISRELVQNPTKYQWTA